MEFLPADYALGGLTCVLVVLGLFRGLSGMLAFVLASLTAVVVGMFVWPYSVTLTVVMWQRALGSLLVVLLSFGLVRIIVRKFVNGLLAQPADALFGLTIGLACGVLLVLVWAKIGIGLEYSAIVQKAAPYVDAAYSTAVGASADD